MTVRFIKYHPMYIDHVRLHLGGTKMPGSVFTAPYLRTPQQVADFAYSKMRDQYNGIRKAFVFDCRDIIGLDSLIAIRDIPPHTTIKIENREPKARKFVGGPRPVSYSVNIAYGLHRRPTSRIVILAGPVEGSPNDHAFYTIYPGEYAPDFTEKVFWRNHAFIREDKYRPHKK